MWNLTNRYEFLAVAILFEGSLLGVAGAIGWWFEVDSLASFSVAPDAMGWGLAAVLPMLALFQVLYALPWEPARRIRQMLLDALGPSFAVCRWYDLLLLAVVAGFSEEVLFRGALQPLLTLLGSSVLFGLVHPLSLLYVVLAGSMGAYLGWLFEATGNLLAPIVTHAVYDFLAFLLVTRDYRRTSENRRPNAIQSES